MSESEINSFACFLCWNSDSSVGRNAQLFLSCWAEFLSLSQLSSEFSQASDQLRICKNCSENCAPFCYLYKEWQQLDRQLIGKLTNILERVKMFAGRNLAPKYHHASITKLRRELLQRSREKVDNYPKEVLITPKLEIKTEDNSSDLGELQTPEDDYFSEFGNEDQFDNDANSSEVTSSGKVMKSDLGVKVEATTAENPDVREGGQPKKIFRTYSCSAFNCDMKFQTANQLYVHLTHHGEFPCNFCTSTFTYAPQLSLHESKKHAVKTKKRTRTGNRIRFRCARCPFGVTRERPYVNHHLQKHLNLEIVSLECPICQLKVANNFNLKEHQKFHQIEGLSPSQIFTCSQCSVQFNSTGSLVMHQKQVHLKSSNTCQICAKSFTSSYNLRLHLKAAHPETPAPDQDFPFACPTPHCGRRFHLKMWLQRHQQNCGQPQEQILCPECGKSFKEKRSMEYHVITQHREHKHVCDECGEKFAFPKYLESHKQSRHNNDPANIVQCSECGKGLTTQRKLYDHMREVHNPRDQLCSECGKGFKTRKNLERHVDRMHKRKKITFECKVCGRICVSRGRLEIHKRSHVKDKPFGCSHCDKKFKQKRGLDEHMKQEHTGVDFSKSPG